MCNWSYDNKDNIKKGFDLVISRSYLVIWRACKGLPARISTYRSLLNTLEVKSRPTSVGGSDKINETHSEFYLNTLHLLTHIRGIYTLTVTRHKIALSARP